jgi:hypothetical protein
VQASDRDPTYAGWALRCVAMFRKETMILAALESKRAIKRPGGQMRAVTHEAAYRRAVGRILMRRLATPAVQAAERD